MFKQMRALSDKAERAYGMSATVIENRLDEAYCILRVIAPGIIPSRKYFERSFCVRKEVVRDVELDPDKKKRKLTTVVGYKNIPYFRNLISPVFYGRLQTDPEVEQQLPDDIHKDVEILMSREQSSKYLEAETGLLRTSDDAFVSLGVLASLTVCQQLANSPAMKNFDLPSAKEEALLENLLGSLSGEKVAVFSKFRSQIDRIENLLKQAGLHCVRITGKETQEEREAARVAFQSVGPKSANIILLTKAGQKALNLQSGNHMIMFDMPWSYGMYRQLVGRMKRTGSIHQHVGVYRYMAVMHPDVVMGTTTDTIDHHILKVLLRKKSLFNAVLGDETTIETTDADLMDVYKQILKSRGATVEV
jgi:SNF2 family DNA or RNA helicase